MIPTYGRILSAIEKALWELIEEYWGVRKSLQNLVEGQKKNIVQLERIGARKEKTEKKRVEMKRRGLYYLSPVRLVVLFFFFNCYFLFCYLNV